VADRLSRAGYESAIVTITTAGDRREIPREPADIGKAAAMLVRGDLPYAPGQVLRLDGGMLVERL